MPKPRFIGAEHIREADLTMGVEILDTNKTLFVAPLNDQAGEDPQPVRCQTMAEVFENFRPKMEVTISDEEGSTAEEMLEFKQISDFSPDAVISQSSKLRDLQQELLLLADLLQQLRKNVGLRKTLDSGDRETLVRGIQEASKIAGGSE